MAQYTLIQERLISGTGVLRVPTNNVKNRICVLYLDVVRMPRNAYRNNNWNPARGKYAFLTYLRNNYVVGSADMEFTRQSYDNIADIAGQSLIATKCAYEGILQTFFNLGNALNLPSISITNLIKDFENLNLMWSEVRIKCYADTAIQARLFEMDYDSCNADADDQSRPPAPPNPLPLVPVGVSIGSISRPYENDTVTTKSSIDEFDPPPAPVPKACDRVRVTVAYTMRGGFSGTFVGIRNEVNGLQFAPISNAIVGGSPGNSYIAVIGGYALGTFACDGSSNREVRYSPVNFDSNNPYTSATITKIEIIP